MRKSTLGLTVTTLALPLIFGCVHGKDYRVNLSVEEVPPQPGLPSGYLKEPPEKIEWPKYLSKADQLPAGAPCKARQPQDFRYPCLAYIEFDDMGELRDRGQDGTALQVEAALATIKAAVGPPAAKSQPIVMVFVHGWKHNASPGPPEDANVQGVKDFLNVLHDHYPDQFLDENGNTCKEATSGCSKLFHPVVGVYIAWRGNSISEAFPVTQTFSYFGREKAAYRVGNTSLTDTLSRISAAAHPDNSDNDPLQPFLLLMGHSFGGLVLERALAQSTMARIDDVAAKQRNASFADLVIYVNTAEAATDSKQVLDKMASNGITGTQMKDGKPVEGSKRYPQIISLSSSWDQATLSAVTVGHALPTLQMKMAGSLRKPDPLVCFEPETGKHSTIDKAFSQADFYLRTAPHFEAMQSHELKRLTGDDCSPNYIQSVGPSRLPWSKSPDPNRRKDFPEEAKLDSFGPTPLMDNLCYVIVPKNIETIDSPRCNGTAYFVMEVPREIIPDHGTIFTQRLFQLLSVFLPPSTNSEGLGTQQKGIITRSRIQSNKTSR